MSGVTAELYVRKMTVEDALATLDLYLQEAYFQGLGTVRIVHGKGTGTLRKAVRECLRSHPLVKSFRSADLYEGDAGATVVQLKELAG